MGFVNSKSGMSLKSVAALKRFIESKVGMRSAGWALEGARDGVEGILSSRDHTS